MLMLTGETFIPPSPVSVAFFLGKGNNILSLLTGKPCDQHGNYIAPGTLPMPFDNVPAPNDWSPFASRVEFETAEFLYTRNQMSAGDIDTLLELWGASLLQASGTPPFNNHRDLYKTIDNAKIGDVPWKCFNVRYQGAVPAEDPPSWMVKDFDVWYRDPHEVVKDMLGNKDFKGEMDAAPFREYDADGERKYQHFMSGNWAWDQAVVHVVRM